MKQIIEQLTLEFESTINDLFISKIECINRLHIVVNFNTNEIMDTIPMDAVKLQKQIVKN
jgi:hypothetical protein